MGMEDMAKLMQMMMSSNNSEENPTDGDSSESSESGNKSDAGGGDFSGFFDNIDFDMISKIGELFSRMNKPDMNAELLLALKPHLRDENQHKIDTAVKLSRMISMVPFLKDSGILKDLF